MQPVITGKHNSETETAYLDASGLGLDLREKNLVGVVSHCGSLLWCGNSDQK